jgi:hypothetical protein
LITPHQFGNPLNNFTRICFALKEEVAPFRKIAAGKSARAKRSTGARFAPRFNP